ncbi:Hint domain-containing protein [Flavobacterium sp. SaA2.13]|uniref:Hint domain-containing protein n=2 Tax=Flavobacterium TaxID=237 RepID=UPI0027D2DBD7|nr:Hint domain-containing protein [Flavobacterium sp. SaA2.13]
MEAESSSVDMETELDGGEDWYKKDGNIVYDKNINSQKDLNDAGIKGEYLFEEGSMGGYDNDQNLQGSYQLNSDGSVSVEGKEVASSGFEEISFDDFSVFGSTEASQNGSHKSDMNMAGPVLLAAGQPIKALKPIGALGSSKGSSVASYVLSKALPQKLPFRMMGSTVLGRGLGRLIPAVGMGLIIYEAATDKMLDPAIQGPHDMQKDINEGKLTPTKMIKKYSCFVKGTKVQMADGKEKNIEDIVIGDKILSVNIERMYIEPDLVIDIPNTNKKYKEIKAEFSNGIVNHFSPAHPFWVKGKGWAVYDTEEAESELEFKVSKLEKGDVVLFLSDGNLIEVSITILEPTGRTVEMFNVEFVKKNHTFFANGILVHNKRIN